MASNTSGSARIGKTLLVLMLTFVLLASSAYLLRGPLMFGILRVALFDYGISLHEMQGLRISPSGMRIASLHMSLPGAETRSTVENLQVDFTLRELLKGELREVTLAMVDLSIAIPDSPASSPISAPDIKPIIAMLVNFPIARVHVESLAISPWLEESTLSIHRDSQELFADIESEGMQIEMRANWHDKDFVSSHFIPENDLASHSMDTGTLSANVGIRYQGNQVLNMDFSALQTNSGTNLDLEGDVNLDRIAAYTSAHAGVPAALGELDGKLALRAGVLLTTDTHSPQQFTLQISPTALQLPFRNELILLQIETFGLDGECTASGECHLSQNIDLSGTTQSGKPVNLGPTVTGDTQDQVLRANGLKLQGPWDVQTTSDGLRVELLPGFDLALTQMAIDTLEAIDTSLHVEERLTLQWDNADTWHLNSTSATLRATEIRFGETRTSATLALRDIRASGTLSDLPATKLSVSAGLNVLSTNALPLTLHSPEMLAQVEFDNKVYSLSADIRVAERALMHADVDFDYLQGEGSADLRIPRLEFGADAGSFASMFATHGFAADIVAGSLEADAALSIHRSDSGVIQFNGPLHAQLHDLSGFVDETAIVGVNADLRAILQDDFALQSSAPTTLTVKSIDPGVAVQNIVAEMQFDTGANTFSLAGLEASLFSGSVRSEGGIFALDKPEGTLQLHLEKINLADILTLSAYEGVTASGLVSGTLPVSLRDGSVSIAAGALFAEFPGGNIRYSGSGEVSGNAALDFVNKTLSNYQYDVMETGVNYLPNGDLALAVQLQGTNPDTNPGQRINLNLNISDNIPTLLRSLQAGRTITEAVEQQLQRR
jgi:hypothetical protein